MAGRANAVASGDGLAKAVAQVGRELGLESLEQVRVARRIWGAVRFIDVVVIQPGTRKTLGLECKYQGTLGTAEEKIPATIQDIAAWPIPGLVVFAGEGFTENMRSYLISTGKAVEFEDLKSWLCLFFGLPLAPRTSRPGKRSPNRSEGEAGPVDESPAVEEQSPQESSPAEFDSPISSEETDSTKGPTAEQPGSTIIERGGSPRRTLL